MLYVILAILGMLCVMLLGWNWSQQRNLRSAAKQLQMLEEQERGAQLRLAVPNAAAEELLDAVNRLLELRQADRAAGRAREQELRRQISNVSHDLRTPLTSILGYLQLLEDDALPDEQRKEYLRVVEGRAKSLQSLISTFYDLSRVEGGEFPLERKRVDLRSALSELLASFYSDFIDAGFEMEVDLPPDLPAVQADPGGVLRVFSNLLRNALDHGAGSVRIRLYSDGKRVVSECCNKAPGLVTEDVTHVFERFFTSDKMRTGRNTGLGLAIVKTLAEQMGCTVSAEGAEGDFCVRITWILWKEI